MRVAGAVSSGAPVVRIAYLLVGTNCPVYLSTFWNGFYSRTFDGFRALRTLRTLWEILVTLSVA